MSQTPYTLEIHWLDPHHRRALVRWRGVPGIFVDPAHQVRESIAMAMLLEYPIQETFAP